MRRFIHENSLSLVLFGLFLASVVGQALTGWHASLEERRQHAETSIMFTDYLKSGHYISAVFENWESEFLQMGAYVLLTVFLRQKGSPESKKLEGDEEEEADPRDARLDPAAPWPVRQGGAVLWLYSNSLSIAMFSLFLLSFWLHAVGSTMRANEEAAQHEQPATTVVEHLGDAEFWYESFQNWQSEFLSIGLLVVLGIFLRQKGSPESKPVAAPHDQTGR
jgi:hypothetical protein